MRAITTLLRWLSAPGTIALLFALYLLPRLTILLLKVEPTSDAEWYFSRAVGLAAGHGYSEGGVLTAYWPPGWPLALSVVFAPFGASVLAAQIFNLACALVTAWLTLDLGRRLFNSEVAGRASLLMLAIYPNSFGYVPLVFTEVFYTMLLLAGCWVLVVWRRTLGLVFAGLVLGSATLVKAQTLMVIPLIFGIAILRDQPSLKRIGLAVAEAAGVMVIAILVILPWSYRNYQVFGEWIFVSTNGGLTLLTGNNPSARGDYTADDSLVVSIQRSVGTQLAVDKQARRLAVEWIRQNPGRFIALMPLKLFRLWAPDGESEWFFQKGYKRYDTYASWFRAVRYLNQAYYVCLLVGFAWAGILLFPGKAKVSQLRIDWWVLPYAVALYPTAIALIFSGQSRFHYPVMPFIAMCCGWLLVALCSDPGIGGDRANSAELNLSDAPTLPA